MSRSAYRGPKLPKSLLGQVQQDDGHSKRRQNVSRKDRRKAERQQKKSLPARQPRTSRGAGRTHNAESHDEEDDDDGLEVDEELSPPTPPKKEAVKDAKPLKSILKKTAASLPDLENGSERKKESSLPRVSRAVQTRLDEDDAEIASLEKKLRIKGKKSKALREDGLDWIVDGSDGESGDEGGSLKRKRPEDSKWLQEKRLKASGSGPLDIDEDEEVASEASSEEDEARYDEHDELIENPFSENEIGSDDFDDFDSQSSQEANELAPPKRQRENPYVAPVTKESLAAAKYVPPSLRNPVASDEEALRQLRRQLQGLLNRLSEANLLSILKALEELYEKNARQHITITIVDILVGLVSDPSTLNDTFLILHAGFSAAVYKVIGTDFGAKLLEKCVESFDRHREGIEGKQTLNLIAFLSCLYTFQLVGTALIFDYIRLLLGEVSENNTELLLRVIRSSGQQLRQDDPSSLKDIVLLLQRSVTNVGEANLSVRSKFMIETINNLKNNRMKTGVVASAISTELTVRMKKLLSSLTASRSVKVTEPLRITLSDIRDSEKRGKWWLVGASYQDPFKADSGKNTSTSKSRQDDTDAGDESETPGSVNLHRLARTQGMNTDVRRSIFITLLSSSDCNEAHTRLLKLHLKAKQMLEVPRVLIYCVGAEEVYNPFYALVARQFCGEHRMRKAFQFVLWDAFKAMGEREDADDEGDVENMSVRKIVNLAKFYGTLIANRTLDITVLKKLDLLYLQSEASMFVEVLLTTVFVSVRKTHSAGSALETAIKEIFALAAGVPGLSQGLQYVIESKLLEAELANGRKDKHAVKMGCGIAMEALTEVASAAPVIEEDEDEDDD